MNGIVGKMSSISVLSSRSEETDEPAVPIGSFRNPNDAADKQISSIQKDIHLKEKERKRREDGWNEFAVSGNHSHSVRLVGFSFQSGHKGLYMIARPSLQGFRNI